MTDENALVQVLNREGVIKFLQDKKLQLWNMFCALKYAHQIIFPPEVGKENCVAGDVICPLVWGNLQWAVEIQNLFVTHPELFNMRRVKKIWRTSFEDRCWRSI